MLEASAIPELVCRARTRDKQAIAQLVTLFEDRRPAARELRAQVQRELEREPRARDSVLIGITGSPGSGKSSLVSRLAPELLDCDGELSVAVLAVDPSSPVSGGALLGDRTRMQESRERERLYFRSQASDQELGGLGPNSFQVCRLLAALFDCVILETVGVGQSEADIQHLADRVYLVLAPLGGDEVQLLKAGIVEIPHAFIVNKCDEPASERAHMQLRASLWLARPFDADEIPIFRTSARTGAGIPELARDILKAIRSLSPHTLAERAPHFFERWVREDWGREGVAFLDAECGGARAFVQRAGGFDQAQIRFPSLFVRGLASSSHTAASSSGGDSSPQPDAPRRRGAASVEPHAPGSEASASEASESGASGSGAGS